MGMGIGERMGCDGMGWDGMGKGDGNRDGERMEWERKGDGNREKDGMGKGMRWERGWG